MRFPLQLSKKYFILKIVMILSIVLSVAMIVLSIITLCGAYTFLNMTFAQAKIQIASTRRYGAKTPSFPDSRVLVATRSRSRSDTTPWCHSLRSRRFATSTPTINTPTVSKRKVAKEFCLFQGGRFVNRPYDQKHEY